MIFLPHPTPHSPHPTPLRLLRTPAASRLRHLAFEDPYFDADDSVRRLGQGQTVIDVGLERVQRKAPVLIPLGARDFGAVQAPAHADFDALRAEAESRFHGLLHGATEGDTALQLRGDVLSDQLSVKLRTLDFLDVDVDLAVDHLLQLVAQLVDLGALASDDDAGTRGVDIDAHLVGRALDVDLRDSGVGEALFQIVAKLQIAMQRLGVSLPGKPAGVPRLVDTKPKSVGVDLLTQDSLRYFARARPLPPLRSLTALTSSDTCTVTCACRFWMR